MSSQNLPKPQAVLFDLDGTLLDNSDIVVETYHQGMIELGYPPVSKEKIASLAGKSTIDTAKALGLQEIDWEGMDQWFWLYFTNYCKTTEDRIELIPNTSKVLELLRDNDIKMGVVTSNSSENAKLLLQRSGHIDVFVTIIGREDVTDPKPASEAIIKALSNMEITVSPSVFMVGDSASDIGAAKNAGVTSIAIPQPHTRAEIIDQEPDYITGSMTELLKLLENCLE